ncbi:MAG: amidohydrolase family protein, partial [Planctomycetaceae bacterium]|nr:amidohydrolase family protein [Planctomycetaceae bacterium]
LMRYPSLPAVLLVSFSMTAWAGDPPTLILHHGKIATVDSEFSIAEAIAIRGERVLAVGTNEEITSLANDSTQVINLQGKTVLPGLIDSHVHPTGASVFEFDHPIPEMETIADVLSYVKSRADALDDGEWIRLSQVFITRLRDQRFPTRHELDAVAPKNPVYFRTGPDAALNSLALELNGIDKDFQIPEGESGRVERDPQTGEPTGIIRSAGRYIKTSSRESSPNQEQKQDLLRDLLQAYNAAGITSIADRNGSSGGVELYESLLNRGELTCRVFVSRGVNAGSNLEVIEKQIQEIASHPRHESNRHLWIRGVKIFLDGGMLTGSAYMRQPWGVSEIYGISDPEYRGLRYVEPEKLYRIAKMALENDLQMTAHSVGDGAVQSLVDAYARIDENDFKVREHRPCVTHCNFMTPEAIETMSRLGIVADLQPAWLWLDGKTLLRQFGNDRMRYFQPYRTLFSKEIKVGGGSDHMQKIGKRRSVNPYDPFLAMWIAITREPRGMDTAIHPEEAISREQAIRLYTINNAWLTFEEHEKGSLEPGKLADLIVVDRDPLTCPLEDLADTQVLQTYLGGKLVHERAE